jgi:hypothetical protein
MRVSFPSPPSCLTLLTEKKVQVEVLEQRLQFLGGGHRLRVSV